MGISAKDAAERVGLTRQGIIKAIKTGKLSAQKDRRGQWVIEPVELFQVYPPVDSSTQQPVADSSMSNTHGLQVEIRELRARLADKDGVIDDLRRRLDTEADERRRLAMLLTDASSTPPKTWWSRLWRGSE